MRYFSFGYGYLGVDLCHIGEFQHRLSGEHVGSQVHVLGSDDACKRSCEGRVGELLAGDAFSRLCLFQFAFYLHPFHIRDGSRLVQGQESSVCILRLFQGGECCPVSLLHGGRVDGGEQLSLAHSISFFHPYGSDVSGYLEAECRSHLFLDGSHIVFRSPQVCIPHGDSLNFHVFLL